MQWLIQDSGVTFDALDRNVKPLVEAVDKRGLPRVAVGYVPFEHTLTGVDGLDRSTPTIFYGSTKLAQLAANSGFSPAAFYDDEWFDPTNWEGKRSDLLNAQSVLTTAGTLRRNWPLQDVFVKSIDPKILSGMVIDPTDRVWFLEENSHIPDDTFLVMSEVQKIDQEWRFFIIAGEVVAGSQYKKDGMLRIREPIREHVWQQARRMAKLWLPNPTIVMDICLMRDGSYRVVEFNCLNSSGFYSCDVGAVVDAIENQGSEGRTP